VEILINVILSPAIDIIAGQNIDDYVTAITGLEWRKTDIGKITLPHPIITLDISIYDIVRIETGMYICIKINNHIGFRGYIDKIRIKSSQKVIIAECYDILKKLNDITTDSIEQSFWYGSDSDIYPYATYYHIDGYPLLNPPYIIRILFGLLGIPQTKIMPLFINPGIYPLIGSYRQYKPTGGSEIIDINLPPERLLFHIYLFQIFGKPEGCANDVAVGDKRGTCLELLQSILNLTNHVINYFNDYIIISPITPAIPIQGKLEEDTVEVSVANGYKVKLIDLAGSPVGCWDSEDHTTYQSVYPAAISDPESIEFPFGFFPYYYQLTYLSDGTLAPQINWGYEYFPDFQYDDNYLANQIALKYYNMTRSSHKSIFSIDGFQYYTGGWYLVQNLDLANKKTNIEVL
jgi:hypothetical protein